MNKRRVVVTGMGMLTPVGLNVGESWQNILAGVSGVDTISEFDTTDFSTKIWAKIKNLNIEDHISHKDVKKMDLFTQYGMVAADEALADANLTLDEVSSHRAGVAVGD